MFERILVCLDGSELAEQTLPYVIEHARQSNGKLLLLRVVSFAVTAAAAGSGEEDINRYSGIAESGVKDYLTSVARAIQHEGIDAAWLMLKGTPGSVIVDCSINNNVDLIAMTTHGSSGLGQALFGSVADYVIRESELPILLIKPSEAKMRKVNQMLKAMNK